MKQPTLWADAYWERFHEADEARRRQGAVHRETLPDGARAWVVYGHAAALEALHHPGLLRDADEIQRIMRRHLGPDVPLSGMFAKSAMLSDGADRERLLAPLKAHLGPRMLRRLGPRVEEITAELLDGVDGYSGPVDLMREVAFPLPITVLAELLGLPETDRPQVRSWTSALMGHDQEASAGAGAALTAYFQDVLAAKCHAPAADLVSTLVQARDAGDLDDTEIMGTLFLLIVAGHETTMNLIGNGTHALLTSGAWARLAQDSSLVDQAVNEVLRLDCSVRVTPHRYSATEVTIAGTTIPPGEIVLVSLGSANRDPERFGDDAHVLDIHRPDASSHLAFGHGARHCLGAPLARIEGAVVLRELTRRWPRAELAPNLPNRREQAVFMSGWHTMWVQLRP
ncbi:cytochrome P450 [Streptomyces sp. NPDC012751]|uniref:cytochrome P450 n=1 Tax=Streptomyces sp. NPDC012751 TaxID=3364846 RepID=UPI0036A00A2A